jgi:hypothetical protein
MATNRPSGFPDTGAFLVPNPARFLRCRLRDNIGNSASPLGCCSVTLCYGLFSPTDCTRADNTHRIECLMHNDFKLSLLLYLLGVCILSTVLAAGQTSTTLPITQRVRPRKSRRSGIDSSERNYSDSSLGVAGAPL